MSVAKQPVVAVDLSKDTSTILQALHQGCSQGCFYVTNHGVPQDLVEAMFAQSAAFFNQPNAAKAAVAAVEGSAVKSGWHASGSVKVDKEQKAGDTRELLRLVLTDVDVSRHPLGKDAPVAELLTGPPAEGLPLWPDHNSLPDFQPVMLAYFAAMNNLADRLIRLAAQALGLNPEAFLADDAAQTLPAWQTLLLLHYPPTPTDVEAGEYACGPHKDRFTQFTLLANTPGSSGLEAQRPDGSWYEVPPLPGAFIINVGCVLEFFSNGVFKAPVHRVVNPGGTERYSAPFYRGAAPGTLLRPMVPAPTGCSSLEPVMCADWMKGFATAFKAGEQQLAASTSPAGAAAAAT